MANLNNLVYDSDFPQDKIIFMREIDWTPNPAIPVPLVIPHGLSVAPFVSALATIDDWATAYPNGTMISAGQYFEKEFIVGSDETNIYVFGWMDHNNTVTAKVRIWGVFNEAATENIVAAATTGDFEFLVNTDYNYPKLAFEGEADASSQTITVSHNLGFIPHAELWTWGMVGWGTNQKECWIPACTKEPNILEQPYSGTTSPLPPYLTTTQLVLRNGKYYYRIYNDQAV